MRVGLQLPLLLACLPFAAGLRAQSVELRVREEAGLAPVAGAIVRLLDDRGTVAQGLTNELGLLVLRARGAGSYRIKIDRIGWAGIVTQPLNLAAGEILRREIRMPASRLSLPPLITEARTRCDRGSQGGALAALLWEEIRKALTANVLTQQAGVTTTHQRQFLREVSLKGEALRMWYVSSAIGRGPPFRASPASVLARQGFVRADGDSLVFAAPDAATILSDAFVASHCFRAVPGANSLVGLAFEPVRGRQVPDVSGTLWVSRETSELRSLEFRYTSLQGPLRDAGLGGRVAFQRLSNGLWIVNDWHIRMPRIEARDSQQVRRMLAGYLDGGGRAEPITDTLGHLTRAIVHGRVFDSTVGSGLVGAFVGIAGVADSIQVDREGRFLLAVDASGDRLLTVHHPKLELLGAATSYPVLLSIGDSLPITVAIRSVETLLRRSCRNQPGLVGLAGFVRDGEGRPAAKRELLIMLQPTKRPTAFRSDERGLFAVCNLPARRVARVAMLEDGATAVEWQVALEGKSRWVELREAGGADSTVLPVPELGVLPKAAILLGVVRDSSGRPLPSVEVLLEDTRIVTSSDSAGGFVLDDLVAGSFVAVFRLAGYRLVRRPIVLVAGDTTRADIILIPDRLP